MFVLGGWNTTHSACPCQFSAESDELMLSGGAVDVGPQGENINFLSSSDHPALFSTNSLSIYDFGGSFSTPDPRLLSRHAKLSI
jgi:hypothetical protein